ncbi:MAG: hypothetical protein OXP37_06085 [Chloroflexota bacterium]|nr:hypothetical protein [Chloroflexota bacterium]
MLGRGIRKAAHVAVFALAFALFYLGLSLGLQYDAALGTACWAGAAVLVGLNVLWMVRARRNLGPD